MVAYVVIVCLFLSFILDTRLYHSTLGPRYIVSFLMFWSFLLSFTFISLLPPLTQNMLLMKVINAFAKSNSPSKAVEAESILHMMLDSYNNGNQQAKPSVITYSAIMNACAYTQGDREDRRAAFRIAQSCLKQIVSGGGNENSSNKNNEGPNNIVFRTFFTACANLVPPGDKRNELVRLVFEECCRRGMLDVKIIVNLRRSFSNDLVSSLCSKASSSSRISNRDHLARGRIELEDLPLEWRSNITLHARKHIR